MSWTIRDAAHWRSMSAQCCELAGLKVHPVHGPIHPCCVRDIIAVPEAHIQNRSPVLVLVEKMRLFRAGGDIVGVQRLVPGCYQELGRGGSRESEARYCITGRRGELELQCYASMLVSRYRISAQCLNVLPGAMAKC